VFVSELDEEFLQEAARQTGKDPDLLAIEEAAARLHAKGVDFTVEHGRVVRKAADKDRETVIDIGSQHVRLGVVSDTHFGSKYEQLTALRHFYRYADEQGVQAFVHAGDLTQGPDRMHRGMELEVHAHGAEAQVAYTVALYPTSAQARTYVVTGNHDGSFLKDNGTNVVRQVTHHRPDLVYLGQDAAYLTIGGLRIYVMHPNGPGAYAKSYKLQKLTATIPVERDVSLFLMGHYHNFGMTKERTTLAVMLPCFQSQYPWLATKGLHPDVGGIILDVWLDDAGRPARVSHELVSYQPVVDDWDHEVSNAVARGWTPGETAA
jgi:predicted phosphodiesterase